jgi:hypothetical protein
MSRREAWFKYAPAILGMWAGALLALAICWALDASKGETPCEKASALPWLRC